MPIATAPESTAENPDGAARRAEAGPDSLARAQSRGTAARTTVHAAILSLHTVPRLPRATTDGVDEAATRPSPGRGMHGRAWTVIEAVDLGSVNERTLVAEDDGGESGGVRS